MKTIKKQPPSDRSQQFKDGLLWADCVALLEKDDVTLVSDDKAFYEDHDHSKGLSRILASECANSSKNIRLLYRLTDLLDELREDVSIDKEALAKCYIEGTEGRYAQEMVARNGFKIQELSDANISIFATESIRRLAIEFDLTFECVDISDSSRDNASLRIRGDGYYHPAEQKFESLSPLETAITFKDEFGELQRRAGIYARLGTTYFGHASVTHIVRHELNSIKAAGVARSSEATPRT